MKILTTDKIREADAYTIEHEPIASIDLMERAARRLLLWVTERFGMDDAIKIFVGPGNNGGDGWALARLLSENFYQDISVYLLAVSDTLSQDSRLNRERLTDYPDVRVKEIKTPDDFPEIGDRDVLIDALFGSGLSRPLEGLAAQLVSYINKNLPRAVVSVDTPSGLFSDGLPHDKPDAVVHACHTLSFQFPKLAFLFPENDPFTGEWHILPIGLHPEFIDAVKTPYYYIEPGYIRRLLRPRQKFSHKGTYGHALLIAGSYGMMGAAVLAAKSALRAGLGLLTTHVPRLGVDILQTAVPESLTCIDESDLIFTEHHDLSGYSAVGIGPGINQKTNTGKGLIRLLEEVKVPLIIDADGLNLLAKQDDWQEHLPENTILTPHPKEFERLFGTFPDSISRLRAQMKFSEEHRSVVVLKGAHTCITAPDGKVHFNSTGNPGMAKGGCGDILTGIILGLLAQGYPVDQAAIIGVYIHGLAGDIAAAALGQTSLIPSDLLEHMGIAFTKFERD